MPAGRFWVPRSTRATPGFRTRLRAGRSGGRSWVYDRRFKSEHMTLRWSQIREAMSRQLRQTINGVRIQLEFDGKRSRRGQTPKFRCRPVPTRKLRAVGLPVSGFHKTHHRLTHAEKAGPIRRGGVGRKSLHTAENPAVCALHRRQAVTKRNLSDDLEKRTRNRRISTPKPKGKGEKARSYPAGEGGEKRNEGENTSAVPRDAFVEISPKYPKMRRERAQ